MTLASLLRDLERCEVSLWVDGGALRYRARRRTLTAELKEAIATHKRSLLKLLSDRSAAPGERIDGATDAVGDTTLLPLLSFLPEGNPVEQYPADVPATTSPPLLSFLPEGNPVEQHPADGQDTAFLPLLSFLPGGNPVEQCPSGCTVPGCEESRFVRDATGSWWCEPHAQRGTLFNVAAELDFPPLDEQDPQSGGVAAWREHAAHLPCLALMPRTQQLRALAAERTHALRNEAPQPSSGVQVTPSGSMVDGRKESKGSKAGSPDITEPCERELTRNQTGNAYLMKGELDPALAEVGYQLCRVCKEPTVHRTICLRCSPRTPMAPVRWDAPWPRGTDEP